ncbi:MAG: Gfo/Idh/MocA family oxidoreductase [Fimbriimonadaceae bacterium]|nr:Gfo/Idh/MocA family oxidoreductase [Fimbriimonadaceae bacterium]
MALRAAIIGCGKPWKSTGATGSGISHQHAVGYRTSSRTELVALADIVRENAEAFRDEHGGDAIYTDYREMLHEVRPDIVSICTWPHLHEPMVTAAAEIGIRAIHCEKPIAPSWGAAKRMVAACETSGTQLTFNHQRRFDRAYVMLRDAIARGDIGDLQRLETPTGNLFDWGTHWFDMMFFLNGEHPAEFVLAQIDPTGGPTVFGVKMESRGITHVQFSNGVQAIMVTGDHGWPVQIRAVGSRGVIEIGATGWDSYRIWAEGSPTWVEHDTSLPEGTPSGFSQAIDEVARCLELGVESQLSARRALRATELIFAAYQSARGAGKVSIPMTFDDATIYAY